MKQDTKVYITDCRAYAGTKLNRDHRLVIAKTKTKWSHHKKNLAHPLKDDIQCNPSKPIADKY